MNRNLVKSNRELSPWSGFRDDLWDLFDRFAKDFDVPSFSQQTEFVPKIEVKDTGDTYRICAEVPGMSEKDINLTMNGDQLVIEGEKKKESKDENKEKGYYHSEFSYGHFYRAISLGEDVDPNKVTASYENGLLNIEVQKNPERSSKNRRIPIQSGKALTQDEKKH
jgi:HSP20 family protein